VILTRNRHSDLANEIARRGPIAFDQANDRIVDAAGAPVVEVDARVADAATVPASVSRGVDVVDTSPADGQIIVVISLTVVETAPPLAVEWRLVKRDKDGAVSDIDPANPIMAGDQVRLVCRASNAGYLYVLQQEEGSKPVLLVPDARINDGRNSVVGGEEYSVPPYCPEKATGAESCWGQITKAVGRQHLILVFSVDPCEDLIARLVAGPVAVDPATGRLVDAAGSPIEKLDPHVARIEPAANGQGYAARVANTDASDARVVDDIPLTVQAVPRPMAIEWRLTRRDKSGAITDADPSATLLRNDEIRFVFTAKRGGYLWVLEQEEGAKPVIIFPDPQINDGQNYVAADQEYHVPAYCPDARKGESCWQQLTKRAGRKLLIVVFGPEKPTAFVDRVLNGGPISIDEVASGQIVDTRSSALLGLVNPRTPARADAPGCYVVQAVDGDPDSTEELVDAIVLTVDKRAR
jgi:hypothetical protein